MTPLSAQLENDAEIARTRLAGDLDELRHRMTPGQIVDEVTLYAADTPLAEFFRNLMRDVRDNPLPLLLIAAGIGWAMLASALRQPASQRAALPAEPIQRRQRQPAPALAPGEWEVAAVAPAADS